MTTSSNDRQIKLYIVLPGSRDFLCCVKFILNLFAFQQMPKLQQVAKCCVYKKLSCYYLTEKSITYNGYGEKTYHTAKHNITLEIGSQISNGLLLTILKNESISLKNSQIFKYKSKLLEHVLDFRYDSDTRITSSKKTVTMVKSKLSV